MNPRRASNGISAGVAPESPTTVDDQVILNCEAFQRMLSLERKRSERSRKRTFPAHAEWIWEIGYPQPATAKRLKDIVAVLSSATRATDVIGWHKDNAVIGILFTEVVIDEQSSIMSTMMSRISTMLSKALSPEQITGSAFHCMSFPKSGTSIFVIVPAIPRFILICQKSRAAENMDSRSRD